MGVSYTEGVSSREKGSVLRKWVNSEEGVNFGEGSALRRKSALEMGSAM